MMRPRSRYRVYDGDTLLGIFDYKEAAEVTGCPSKDIGTRAHQGIMYKKRFRFEQVEEDDEIDYGNFQESFRKKWNEARAELLKKTGREAYVCDRCGQLITGGYIKALGYGRTPCRYLHQDCFKKERQEKNALV